MEKFFNITAGYDLAQRAVEAIYGLRPDFDYFEDFVDHTEDVFIKTVSNPQKITLLHIFLRNFEPIEVEPDLYDVWHSENYEFLKFYLEKAGCEIPNWFLPDQVDNHSEEVKSLVMRATEIIADSAFEILFNDRECLFEFQIKVKEALLLKDTPKPEEIFDRNGNIKRLSYVPSWLEKAIYFRDKGRCQICFKDVSGEIFHLNEYHLDHVLPLSEGGTNDPTNFQILCKKCNLKKKSNIFKPKNSQVKFWAFE